MSDHITKMCHIGLVLFDQMQYQTECCFLSDTGQLCEFIHRIF